MKTAIKIFLAFRSFQNRMSKTAQFRFSKSFFYVKNQPNLSDFFFIGLAYSSLNSAKLSCSSEVTLLYICISNEVGAVYISVAVLKTRNITGFLYSKHLLSSLSEVHIKSKYFILYYSEHLSRCIDQTVRPQLKSK